MDQPYNILWRHLAVDSRMQCYGPCSGGGGWGWGVGMGRDTHSYRCVDGLYALHEWSVYDRHAIYRIATPLQESDSHGG